MLIRSDSVADRAHPKRIPCERGGDCRALLPKAQSVLIHADSTGVSAFPGCSEGGLVAEMLNRPTRAHPRLSFEILHIPCARLYRRRQATWTRATASRGPLTPHIARQDPQQPPATRQMWRHHVLPANPIHKGADLSVRFNQEQRDAVAQLNSRVVRRPVPFTDSALLSHFQSSASHRNSHSLRGSPVALGLTHSNASRTTVP